MWEFPYTHVDKERRQLMKTWNKSFPHDMPRACQEEAINFALDSIIDDNKRFVIIEAGTGVGKSAIGLTVARYLQENLPEREGHEKGAYFLTTQKILQEQYERFR